MRTVRINAHPTLAAIAAGVAIILTAMPAAAISSENSFPAPERTEVGFMGTVVDFDGDGTIDALGPTCSGAMIDFDTFLTAAHCTDNFPSGQRFFVSLEEDLLSLLLAHPGLAPDELINLFLANGWIVEGEMHRDPAFEGEPAFPNAADLHEIAVIDFADTDTSPADLWTFTPATLPTAGQLDAIGGRALDAYDWWVVGYGAQEAMRGPGGHTHPGGFVRRKAMLDFTALNQHWVYLAQTAARDLGGSCFGDSGGPTFVDIDGSLVLAGISSWGDIPCYATHVAYRTDTASAREFLADFVELP